MVNILVPMAGEGSRFVKAGYADPKPFIEVEGRHMIEIVLQNLDYPGANFILVARAAHLEKKRELADRLAKKYPITWVTVDKLTEGAACTTLFAKQWIDNDTPLLIANSDQYISGGVKPYLDTAIESEVDGCIMTFHDNHPKWSYAKVDPSGWVTEVKEKVVISDHATVGLYYFRQGKMFVDAAVRMIISNDRFNNEFYTCPTYNYLIAADKKVSIFEIEKRDMWGLGTPEDLDLFLKRSKS